MTTSPMLTHVDLYDVNGLTSQNITAISNMSENFNMSQNTTVIDAGGEEMAGICYACHRSAIDLVDRYMTPVWYVVGFPSNLLSFSVWIQPSMRQSSGCYLATLAMADFIFLILQLIYELQVTWQYRTYQYPFLCQAFPVLFYASQYLSPMLVLGFTVERYISIVHPFKREKFCTTSRAIKVIICLVIFSIVLHAVQAYFWIFDSTLDMCSPRPIVIKGGSKSIWTVWSWITELLVFGLVPIVILILNILVIKEARKLSKAEESMMCLNQKGQKSSAATITLLAVSFYLIFTTLPVTVLYCLQFSFPEGVWPMSDDEIMHDRVWQRHLNYYTLRVVTQEFGVSHYACNFFIYLATGKLFRKSLKILVFKIFCKNKLEKLRRVDFAREMAPNLRGNGEYRRISEPESSKEKVNINGATSLMTSSDF